MDSSLRADCEYKLVIMTIPVGGEIGEVSTRRRSATIARRAAHTFIQEIHTVDQHLSFHSGVADAIVNGKTVRSRCLHHRFCPANSALVSQERVGPGDIVIVPAGAQHNVRNTT